MGVAVDAQGAAYMAGWTESDQKTFPVKIGPDLTFNGGNWDCDAFVAKVNTAGTGLVYCGYIGGKDRDWESAWGGMGIALDTSGNAFVAGRTQSDQTSFPVKNGPDLTFNGWYDAFVAKVNTTGTGLVYCGYIGGTLDEGGEDIAVDGAGNAYLVGPGNSTEPTFPEIVGPDLTHNGRCEAYVAKIASTTLQGSGASGPGTTVTLTLTATDDVGLAYLVGSSLGPGPFPLGNRQVGLSPDDLLVVSVNGYWPGVFSGYQGLIGTNGQAKASINIPNIPALIGLRIYSAFMTLSPSEPLGIKSISETFSFTI